MTSVMVDKLLERVLFHFSHRRDALDVIGRFGNRFEGWVKWEIAVGLHLYSFMETGTDIASVASERDDCDLFIGAEPWPHDGSYPPPHPNDLWIELKARCTRDKGPAELAVDLALDVLKQQARKTKTMGSFVVIALVIAHPQRPDVQKWLDKLSTDERLPPGPTIRRLYADARSPSDPPAQVLAALIGWNV